MVRFLCRVGEFAISANKDITPVIKNTPFDEKIAGTIHLVLGLAYKEKRGGGENQSAIHWDLIKTMRGRGGKILVDGKELKP